MNSLTVEPTGGICNYLRVVFSYWLHCKKNNMILNVIWNITNECNGFFLDYFEPLENVSFFKENPGISVDFHGNRWHPDYNPYAMNIYNGLKPVPYIQSKVQKNMNLLGDYIAVHIRRTDHVWLAQAENHYTDDNAFIEFIEGRKEKNLYISTDNRQTQDEFYSRFQNQIKVIDFIEPNESLRQTSLEKAIVDIFTCVNSSEFKGSGWSTFSGTINQMKEPIRPDGYFERHLPY